MFKWIKSMFKDEEAIKKDNSLNLLLKTNLPETATIIKDRFPDIYKILDKDNLSKQSMIIRFRDLKYYGFSHKAVALTMIDKKTGKIYINIASHLRNSPPEALVCLLNHERVHQDVNNSIREEQCGWRNEAITWLEFLRDKPELALIDDPLVYRLNLLLKWQRKDILDEKVAKHKAYQCLPMYSEGFEEE